MAHPIPISVSSSPGHVPLDDLVLEVVWVAPDGEIAKDVSRSPVTGGVAVYEGPPCPTRSCGGPFD